MDIIDEKDLSKGIHIKAEPKSELEQKHSGQVQPQNTQTPSYSATGSNPEGQNSRQDSPQGNNGGQGTFGASAEKYGSGASNPQPNAPETTSDTLKDDRDDSGDVVDDKGNIVTQESITTPKKLFKKFINKLVNVITCKKCIEGKPEESKLKFYRKKELWIGLAVGFFLGIVLCFAAGVVYSKLPKLELKEELLNYKMPDKVKGPSLFIYREDELDKAVDLCYKADSLLNSADSLKYKGKIDVSNLLKVISNQTEHFKNILCNLEDKEYKLKFEDPAIIKNWVENERIANLNNADIYWIKLNIEYYEKIGTYLKNIISAENRTEVFVKEVDGNTISDLFRSYNDELKGSELAPIRMCIQVFYLNAEDEDYDKKLKTCKNDILQQEIIDNTTHYNFTPQCFKDIYDKVK